MAIVQPNEMTELFHDKKFSMIIAGSPGIGKTTLALSAPNPLLFDLDKGISRVKAQHRKQASIVENYNEMLDDMQSEAFKSADTIIIDTGGSLITYLQEWVKGKDAMYRQKNGDISLKGFGAVKGEFIRLTNWLKTTQNKNIIYVFHTVEEKDKDGNIIQRLMCEGAARNLVWQPCDLGAYYSVVNGKRVLGFTPSQEYFAKGCYGVAGTRDVTTLTDATANDYLTKLFDEARQNIADESKFFEGEKAKYDKAIELGTAIIAGIADLAGVEGFHAKFKSIAHALTSELEIRAMFRDKTKELGVKWNAADKKWERVNE